MLPVPNELTAFAEKSYPLIDPRGTLQRGAFGFQKEGNERKPSESPFAYTELV
ncbi:hypothetical protein Pla100_48670 [Neorhodopirellula pilleata]|uniref:Uncharacterized protein n=1 Tax=Neorhodopirellula pilleata TaxID=2714738 RepID=A0A5C5ZX63_9BACT|nr:hypothetical protein Pla100_48670 [Neorhodopirellula pilleata]